MKIVQVCECEGCHEYHGDSEVIFKCSNCGCEICVACEVFINTFTENDEEFHYCMKCHSDLNKKNLFFD